MHQPMSLARVFSLVLVGLLVSGAAAAGLAAPAAPPDGALIGSVSASGPVELRGVAISREGTLFSGDTLRTRLGSYASVALAGGQRIELGNETDVRVDADESAVQIAMNSGSLIFSSMGSRAMSIDVGETGYEILAAPGAAGDVQFLAGNEVGVRATSGEVTVRSPAGETVVFDAGSSGILPVAGPAGPVLPAPRRQLTDREWLGVGIAAAAGVMGYVLWRVLRDDEASESNP